MIKSRVKNLIIANANLFINNNLVDLIKERSNFKFIIMIYINLRIYSLTLFYSIIYTNNYIIKIIAKSLVNLIFNLFNIKLIILRIYFNEVLTKS